MKKQTNREFVYENIVKMIQTGNYGWDKLETIEPDSILNGFGFDDLDQLDFFMRLVEFFDIDMKELEKRWDEIDTIDELCNHIVVLMNKKQKEQIVKKPAKQQTQNVVKEVKTQKSSLINKIKTVFQRTK